MKTAIIFVGMFITLPFIIIEMIIKTTLYITYYPLILAIAIVYPLIKSYNLEWVNKWWLYATTWKHGFVSGRIYNLWKIEE